MQKKKNCHTKLCSSNEANNGYKVITTKTNNTYSNNVSNKSMTNEHLYKNITSDLFDDSFMEECRKVIANLLNANSNKPKNNDSESLYDSYTSNNYQSNILNFNIPDSFNS